ncbi:histidine phosphatase family protein [Phenylobacterium sp.]|jgi:broad specificity phosphatase PhoE|uniref:histidine phosphatase family protein n=1 Tax=Phenylobacterium sp. TaxID=1871053 RepID=UPI002F3FB22E
MADTLTVELPVAPAARSGAVILARHGEPAISRKVRLSAEEYRRFWTRYELSGIVQGHAPPPLLQKFVDDAGVVIASTRLRSIESAQALAQGREFTREALLVEAPLPPPRLPAAIRLSPRIWGFLARWWWWFFNHHEGAETRRQAEARADQAAAMLAEMAASGRDVVVLAHGFFNFMIGRSLRRMGWRMTASQGFKYWSTRRFERP